MKYWLVDSFTAEMFKGNPAAVFISKEPLSDQMMQNIATELNLSETAFVLERDGQNPFLRWFTPMYEIDLCGHATLAAAHIYMTELYPDKCEVIFETNVAGPLTVTKKDKGYVMDFPSRAGEEVDIASLPAFVLNALSDSKPVYARKARDLMLVYETPDIIKDIKPDFNTLMKYDAFIAVTAPSNDNGYDFVSRFFCADDGIQEDPVTGSAHCTLAPYWADRLGKTEMKARQISKRGGELGLVLEQDRVKISGQAITTADGTFRF